jgi:peptide/nickel transport system permease protein
LIAQGLEKPASRAYLWRIRLGLLLEGLRQRWRLFAQTRIGLVGLAIIGFYALLALTHPILMNTVWNPAVYDPVIGYAYDEVSQPAPPTWSHPLGTDSRGRDVLSQLMSSAGSEFLLGVVAALVTVVIATLVGAVSAYFGGIVDAILMRITDIMIMLPFISLLVVLSAFIDVELLELGIIIGLLGGFGATAIVLKSQALSVKVKPFVEAARAAGGGHRHIILTHIVPALMPLSFLYMMFTVTGAIFSEAALSYLGLLNVRMSWGIMLHNAETGGYLLQLESFWWLVLPSSLSITLLSMSFYLVGRALDEVVNPRLRRA